jgi:hypothetical protein
MTATRRRLRVIHPPFAFGFNVPVKVVGDGSVAKRPATLRVEIRRRGSKKAPLIFRHPGSCRRRMRLPIWKRG